MRNLRLLIIAFAGICVLALAAFAFKVPAPQGALAPADDDIIIKGGSLDVDCGKNHGADCFGGNENTSKPKHKNRDAKIVQIVLRKSDGTSFGTFTKRDHFQDGKPIIQITYRVPRPQDN